MIDFADYRRLAAFFNAMMKTFETANIDRENGWRLARHQYISMGSAAQGVARSALNNDQYGTMMNSINWK